ncbi:hypothetical protein WJX72_009272 [[Myrmecia] bisecta]|uniref:J domain-containing protein n=1 Tax=[Myrmecia] bisecta TaxID=41462 RepID=A0AAW1PLP1_9CHLO
MPRPRPAGDPWAEVDDLDGQDHYRALKLDPGAAPEEIKRAYRELARRHHPDKGGEARTFSKIRQAFEVLSDPRRRAVYDEWAKELQFRYVPGVAPKVDGKEDMLLDEFENLGLHCTPATQLVVTCEVCRRPSTKQCWTCGMAICDFCTLKRHWKDNFPLHWPLINSDHMRTRLAKRELEKKKIEDAHRLALEDPNFRSESELQGIRSFKDAAYRMLDRKDRLVAYDIRLAQHYMWAQTEQFVYVACSIPTGYADREVVMECNEYGLKLQAENSPPVIERAFDYSIDTSRPIETFKTQDNRLMTLAIPKGKVGQKWLRLFRGDSDGVRCLEPIYCLTESDDDVLLELEVPFWTDAEDVKVRFLADQLRVDVRSSLSVTRSYWRARDDKGRQVIDPTESMWSLDEEEDAAGEAIKTLMVSLVKPPLTEDEIMWKKGKRMDHRAKERPGSLTHKGYRFFADDEDELGLEDVLQALCFLETGETYVPAKPWQHGLGPKRVREEDGKLEVGVPPGGVRLRRGTQRRPRQSVKSTAVRLREAQPAVREGPAAHMPRCQPEKRHLTAVAATAVAADVKSIPPQPKKEGLIPSWHENALFSVHAAA